jgi:hypothetical protein
MRARLVADKQGDPMEDNEAQHPTFHHRRRGADGQPRIEIVIEKAIFKLTVDGEPNPETLATLMALADELRSGEPIRVAPAVGNRSPSVRCSKPKHPSPVAGIFRTTKEIVTDLIARLLGHVLGFPP